MGRVYTRVLFKCGDRRDALATAKSGRRNIKLAGDLLTQTKTDKCELPIVIRSHSKQRVRPLIENPNRVYTVA